MSKADELVTAVGRARARERHAEVDVQIIATAAVEAREHLQTCRDARYAAERDLLRFTGETFPWDTTAAAPPPAYSFEGAFTAMIDRVVAPADVTAPAR